MPVAIEQRDAAHIDPENVADQGGQGVEGRVVAVILEHKPLEGTQPARFVLQRTLIHSLALSLSRRALSDDLVNEPLASK
ncbi:hypothetical protein GCM10022211_20630 [Sphingomonas humi]|uniref:Uncharacterized protein n=1 Tax=Sphingomonas humi TaxID=335630 RepID=A0ABP7S6X9_9SPHN